ncbi:MAG TPA: hypothetical protein VFE51_11185 [Verrucomicrobiae bacterium]|nr:hypothetical protein [Verrucomicrobiae bacterium]
MSPVKLQHDRSSWTEEIIDLLFHGNPMLCAGLGPGRFTIQSREQWRGQLAAQKLMVPSPVLEPCSRRTRGPLVRVRGRRFLLLELTAPPWENVSAEDRRHFGNEVRYYCARRDVHAALLWHLGRFRPLVAVVQHDSRSTRGWFYCEGAPERSLFKLMCHGVTLGANRRAWEISHFAVIPDSGRTRGEFQETVYLNPAPVQSTGDVRPISCAPRVVVPTRHNRNYA